MKFLLLLIVIAAVIWLARGARGRVAQKPPPPRVPLPEDMVACAECGVHLPRSEALPGRGGLFCTEDHRTAFERAER